MRLNRTVKQDYLINASFPTFLAIATTSHKDLRHANRSLGCFGLPFLLSVSVERDLTIVSYERHMIPMPSFDSARSRLRWGSVGALLPHQVSRPGQSQPLRERRSIGRIAGLAVARKEPAGQRARLVR